MKEDIIYRKIRAGDEDELFALVKAGFDEYVRPDVTEEGANEFFRAAIPSRLPLCALFAFVGTTVLLAGIAAFSGWSPPRDSAGFILPLYFSLLLVVLTLAYIISGNTLMHHYQTGTVQRSTSPRWFWSIVAVHLVIAILLFVLGYVRWRAWHG